MSCRSRGTTNLRGYGAAYRVAALRLGLQLVSYDVRDLVEPGHARLPSGHRHTLTPHTVALQSSGGLCEDTEAECSSGDR